MFILYDQEKSVRAREREREREREMDGWMSACCVVICDSNALAFVTRHLIG